MISENKKAFETVPFLGGVLVLYGYDTVKDLKKAKKDLTKVLTMLAKENPAVVDRILEDYREKEGEGR